MVNSNANALGILFPNSYDSLVPDLVSERLMASIPFASRYRLVDFILSSMANCGSTGRHPGFPKGAKGKVCGHGRYKPGCQL